MKQAILLLVLLFVGVVSKAQDTTLQKYIKVYTVEKNVIEGELISDDGREVTILSPDLGKVIIPKSQIKKMEFKEAPRQKNTDYYDPDRKVVMEDYNYFTSYTTNGLPFNEDEICIRMPYFTTYIVDVPLRKNVTVTFGTSLFWAYFGTGHFRFSKDDDGGFALAISAASVARFTSGYSGGDGSAFALRGCYTIGDRTKNLTIGGGYGSLFNFYDNAGYFFISAMKGILKDKAYFMLESSTVPEYKVNLSNFSFRVATRKQHAFDFGLSAVIFEETINYPPPGREEMTVLILPYLGLNIKL